MRLPSLEKLRQREELTQRLAEESKAARAETEANKEKAEALLREVVKQYPSTPEAKEAQAILEGMQHDAKDAKAEAAEEAAEARRREEDESAEQRRLESRWGELSSSEAIRARQAIALLMGVRDDVKVWPDDVLWCIRTGLLGKDGREKLQRMGFHRQRQVGLHETVNDGIDRAQQLTIAERWGEMSGQEIGLATSLAEDVLAGSFPLGLKQANAAGVLGSFRRERARRQPGRPARMVSVSRGGMWGVAS